MVLADTPSRHRVGGSDSAGSASRALTSASAQRASSASLPPPPARSFPSNSARIAASGSSIPFALKRAHRRDQRIQTITLRRPAEVRGGHRTTSARPAAIGNGAALKQRESELRDDQLLDNLIFVAREEGQPVGYVTLRSEEGRAIRGRAAVRRARPRAAWHRRPAARLRRGLCDRGAGAIRSLRNRDMLRRAGAASGRQQTALGRKPRGTFRASSR